MAKKGMSERQYAVHVGLSRGAIQKAKAAGRVVLYSDGTINAAASDARYRDTTDPAMQRSATPRQMEASGAAQTLGLTDGNASTYLKARTMNEVLKAQDRRLTIDKKKGALVERSRAELLVFKLAREERDAWVNWPARTAALMAAEITAALEAAAGEEVAVETALMQAVLEKHVRIQLESLADVRVGLA